MTLTEAASFTKKAVVFGVILLIFLIVAVLGVQAYLTAQKAKIKPPEEKPTLDYGLLPKANLAPTLVDSSTYNYTLNTQNGTLEQSDTPFPKLIKVYFIPKLGTTLLARDKATQLAKQLKFSQGPDIVTQTSYKFTDETGGVMTFDLDSNNFKFTRVEASPSADVVFDETLPDEATIVKDFQNFLNSAGLFKDQLADGLAKVEYEGSKPEDSKYAQISYWQTDIDALPIVTSNFTHGLIRSTISKAADEEQKYLTLDYNYWEVDTKNFATYPLKDVKSAYEELQAGKSSVVIQPDSPQVSIAKIYLAYLLSKEYSKYLQPVYVFAGENNAFTALVSAIPEENLEK